MKYRLLRPSSFEVTAIEAALAAERIATVEVHSPEELSVTDEPVVLVLDSASRELFPRSDLRSFVERGGAIVALGSEGEEDVAVGVPEDLLTAYLPFPHRARQLLIALRSAKGPAVQTLTDLLAARHPAHRVLHSHRSLEHRRVRGEHGRAARHR